MKIIRENEQKMLEKFAQILNETNPNMIDELVKKLDWLAHERALAIRFETARRMIEPGAFSFIVVDGVLERVSEKDPRG